MVPPMTRAHATIPLPPMYDDDDAEFLLGEVLAGTEDDPEADELDCGDDTDDGEVDIVNVGVAGNVRVVDATPQNFSTRASALVS